MRNFLTLQLLFLLAGCASSLNVHDNLRGKWISDYKTQNLICPGIFLTIENNKCEIDFLPSRCIMSRVPPNVKAFCSFSRDGKDKYLLTNLTTKDQFSLVYEKGKLTISPIYLVNSVREISDTKHILIRENDL